MNWSDKPVGRVFRSEDEGAESEVFVVGGKRRAFSVPAPVATAMEIVEAARLEALDIVAEARGVAGALTGAATETADGVRNAAYSEGYVAGHAEAEAEVARQLAIIRAAAADGLAVRDSIAAESEFLLARALVLAVGRLVAAHYAADPGATADICREALRAAAGQDVIAIRVNPRVVPAVQASLRDLEAYVRPDDAVAIGGCIVDLRHGTVDATLDTRLALFEEALLPRIGEAA